MLRNFMVGTFLLANAIAFGNERGDNSTYSTENPDYVTPKTQELYDSSKPKGRPIEFPSSANFGAFVSFGQSDSQKADENPKAAWLSGASFTYLNAIQTWSRFELGADIFTGQLGHSRAEIPLKQGFLARIGYGYGISGNLFGTIRLGAGLASVQYDGRNSAGDEIKTSEAATATVLYAGWHLTLPAGESLSLDFGPDWSKTDFSLGKSTITTGGNTTKINSNDRQTISTLSLQLGARLKI